MLEKISYRTLGTSMAFGILILSSFQTIGINNADTISAFAELSEDKFGIAEIYPTKQGGNEWFVNMADPRNDPYFKNLQNVQFSKNADGSWRVSADQIRMEAWSPVNEKWTNVEMTMYAKIESGSNDLLQLYSRGGHHTSKDECLGSAYKARLYGDGTAAWNKEVTHPAYAGNRGEVRVSNESLEDRWVGFKAVIYNFEENGKTFVRLESYIDDDVTDSNGNLVIANNWKLASVYEDKGGWSTNNSDFDSSCGRDRDEILTQPGGTATQNIAAFRTDQTTWSFKYLSVREIHTDERVSEDTQPTIPDENIEDSNPVTNLDYVSAQLRPGQHIPSDGITTIDQFEIPITKERLARGIVIVSIFQNGNEIAKDKIEVETSATSLMLVPDFNGMQVSRDFDVTISYYGTYDLFLETEPDLRAGNLFTLEGEFHETDLNIKIV